MGFAEIISIIGIIPALFSVGSFIPFLMKLFKERDLKNVSLMTYIIYVISCMLWILFAISGWIGYPPSWIQNLIVIIPNLLCLLAALVIVIMKIMSIKKENVNIKGVKNVN